MVAGSLAGAGFRTVLLDRRPGPAHGASGRRAGVHLGGLAEPVHRLVHAIGLDRTGELFALADRNARLVHDLIGPGHAAWRAALVAGQVECVALDHQALDRMGLVAQRMTTSQARERLGLSEVFGAVRAPMDRAVHGDRLIRSLVSRATDAGATLCFSRRVSHVQAGAAGLVVRGEWGAIRADMVVFASAQVAREVDPWFVDKLVSVREHSLLTAPVVGALPSAGRGTLGYTRWRVDAHGRLALSGCRWASAHLGVGQTDDRAVNSRVIDALRSARREHMPHIDAPTTHIWTRVETHSCDGLPIVGPMPGAPERVVLAGFMGSSLELACAEGLVRGVLTGRSGLPEWLEPRRFL